MKKLLALVLVAVLALTTLTACGDTSSEAGNNEAATEVKVGVLAPLTGDVAVYGTAVKNGVELAFEEINAAGGINGATLVASIYDEKGDVAEAVNAYNKLSSEEIVALIGDVTSKPSIAVAEIAADERMPMITPTGTAAAITTYGDNIFRACFLDPFQGSIMAKFAVENLEAAKVAVLYNTSDDYSQGVANAFKETAEAKGAKVVGFEGYAAGDKDFKTQLTKIQKETPDVIFVPDYYNTVALIVSQAREIGYEGVMCGADGWDGVLGVVTEDKLSVLDNCYFSNHYSTTDTAEVVVNFLKNYEDKYGEAPNAFAALGYDAAYALADALKNAKSFDHEDVIAAIKAVSIEGVTGPIKFDAETGDAVKAAAVTKIVNGTYELAAKVSE
ncbi:MAG: ABC transporter substrate-binding protein [Oscillospiraceae bacterium]|nr:ABC transporter substrate-binding protein [Oscillospiraceae bacterium]